MSVAPLAVALLLLAPPAQAAAAWRLPVPGPVTRVYDVGTNPYEGGHHRGIDLAARPGATVRAACSGRVVVAGSVGTSGGVVTLLCGHWRVSHMPLATITARTGTTVTAGTNLGTLAHGRDHAGLHLGVRRDGTRFGYADPLHFLNRTANPPPPLGRAPRTRPHARPDHDLAAHGPAPVGAPVSAPAQPPLAPWPVWAGLALVLAGAGAGVRWRGAARTRTRSRLRAGVRLGP